MDKRKGSKYNQVVEEAKKVTVTPPELESGAVQGPRRLETITDVVREQQRLYKLVFSGKLALADLSKLSYSLQNMVQTMKAKHEMDTFEAAYVKQWQGVRIIAPAQAKLEDDKNIKVLDGEVLDE